MGKGGGGGILPAPEAEGGTVAVVEVELEPIVSLPVELFLLFSVNDVLGAGMGNPFKRFSTSLDVHLSSSSNTVALISSLSCKFFTIILSDSISFSACRNRYNASSSLFSTKADDRKACNKSKRVFEN